MKNIKKILLLALFALILIPNTVFAEEKKEYVIDFTKISSGGDEPSGIAYIYNLLSIENIVDYRGVPADPREGEFIVGNDQDYLLSIDGKKLVLIDISEEVKNYYEQDGGYYSFFPLHQAADVTEADNISFTITDEIVQRHTSDPYNGLGQWLEDFYEEYDKITIKFGPLQEQKDVVLRMYDIYNSDWTDLSNYVGEQLHILLDDFFDLNNQSILTNKDGKILYNYQTHTLGDDVTEEDNFVYNLTEEDLRNPRLTGKKRIIVQFVEAEIPPAEEETTQEEANNNIDGNPYTKNNLLFVLLGVGCTIGTVGFLSKKKSNN